MLRTLMQAYVTGSKEAVEIYKQAFDAKLVSAYENEEGSYYHSELDVYGQILAVAEASYSGAFADEKRITGNVMQFCLHFHEDEIGKIEKAVEILKVGSQTIVPLGPCDFSEAMTDFIDRFGIRWCMFI